MATSLAHACLDLDRLRDRDYTIILGKTQRSYEVPNLAASWLQAQATICDLLELCESLDQDGITLYTAGDPTRLEQYFCKYTQLKRTELGAAIQAIYPPETIEFGVLLQATLQDYRDRKAKGQHKANGEMILAFLDGEPSDRRAVVKALVDATKVIDHDEELAIGIVQIGNDALATGFFRALDDDLAHAGARFDIVETQQIQHLDGNALGQFLQRVLND